MNSLAIDQNSSGQLKLLRARGAAYDSSTRLYYAEFFATVGLAALLGVLKLVLQSGGDVLASISIAAIFVDFFVLEPAIKSRRKLGALFQEKFDCDVLKIEWQDLVWGPTPSPEEIEKWGQRQSSSSDLHNWYPASVSKLPLFAARVVCQRASAVWTRTLRERIHIYLWLGAAVCFLLPIVLGFYMDSSVRNVMQWIVIVLPVPLWCAREARRQREGAQTSSDAIECADKVWKLVLRGDSPADIDRHSAALQNSIFEARKSGSPMPRFIYRHYRDRDERSMIIAANTMAAEFMQRNGLPS